MRGRSIVAAALLGGVLVLSACPTASTEGRGSDGDAASATPSATATAEASQADEGPAPAEPVEPVAGAYIDHSDGIAERTVGPKVLFFHASWCAVESLSFRGIARK